MSDLKKEKLINGFIEALKAEITELKEGSGKKNSYLEISFVEVRDKYEKIYVFSKEKSKFIDDNAPIFIVFEDKKIRVKLIEQRGPEFVIKIFDNVNDITLFNILEIDKWSIYEKLVGIYDNPMNDKIAYELFSKNSTQIEAETAENNFVFNESQHRALEKSFNHSISFIWGPPGTGKSYTLINIGWSHYLKGEKVVFVAHSNMAVDRLLKQFVDLYGQDIKAKQFIRLGRSKYEDYTLDQYIERKNPDLIQKKSALYKDLYKNGYTKELYEKIEKIERELEKKKFVFMHRVPIIFTTLTRLFYDSFFPKDKFTVLIDEVSMAPMPYIYYAFSLCDKYGVLAGDFNQLPSIAISNNKDSEKYLKKSIFDYLELNTPDAVKNFEPLTLLDVQYRMNPEISNLANKHFYNNQLTNSELTDANIAVDDKHGESSIICYNMGNSFALKQKGTQRHFNFYNAVLIKELLSFIKKSYSNLSIGVITLYNSEVDLLKAIINDNRITVSTVHKFQGQERDIIIFDFVESFGIHWSMMGFEDSFKLINVAITRAKVKLFVVGDFLYLKQNIHHELIEDFAQRAISPLDLLDVIKIDSSLDLSVGELSSFVAESNFGLVYVNQVNSILNNKKRLKDKKLKIEIFSNNLRFIKYIFSLYDDAEFILYSKNIEIKEENVDKVFHNSFYDMVVIEGEFVIFGKYKFNEFYKLNSKKTVEFIFESLGLL